MYLSIQQNMKLIVISIALITLIFATKNIISSINRLIKNEGATLTQLKKDLEQEKKQTLFLEEQILYVQSEEFLEKEARNKLNLTKENEFIVLAPTSKKTGTSQTNEKIKPIWKKWVEKFTKKR